MENDNPDIIIIGAGFAGLAAGIYAQMNGYKTRIFEMHNLPGGLCTAWNRKSFTIDGCVHWLVGSSPKSGMYQYWEEVGVAQGREFIDMDEYMSFECKDGRRLVFYTDVFKLEKHLLEFSPADAEPIRDFITGIKICLNFDQPSRLASPAVKISTSLKLGLTFVSKGGFMKKWMKVPAKEYAKRFKNPDLANAILEMWLPDFSMFFMFFTFAWLHRKNAGYPIGGSLPLSNAMEQRYLDLGGEISYHSKVEKIIVENNTAKGICLSDGKIQYSHRVISAADGYTTIFKMLNGSFGNANAFDPYNKWDAFPPLIYIGLGVNRKFDDIPKSVSGFSYPLKNPVEIAGSFHERIGVHIYNQDPTLAPEGKTVITLMLQTDYEYWKLLYLNRPAYLAKKEEIANTVLELLEQRFPGIKQQTEMIDVATPMTFERFTGNWKGSFEGWMITPVNNNVLMKPMSQTLNGLNNFYMCGQWVAPGGGLPTSVMSARRLMKSICKTDKRKFITLFD